MGRWDTITGKSVEDKLSEYGGIYGEVLLGLHRDVEQHSARLAVCEHRFNEEEQRVKERIDSLTSFVADLGQELERNRAEVTAGLDSVRCAIAQFQSEAAAMVATSESLSRLAQELSEQTTPMQAQIALRGAQVWQTRFLCLVGYLVAVAVGVALWMSR